MNDDATKHEIAADHVVTIEYRLLDPDGQVVDSSEQSGPITYLHGHGQLVPGLERRLAGLRAGEERTLQVSPAEGFGERDESLVHEFPRAQLEFDVQIGQFVKASVGGGRPIPLRVSELRDETVLLDGNHPLAGKDLRYEVTVVAVRPATAEELPDRELEELEPEPLGEDEELDGGEDAPGAGEGSDHR